jgi:hypothetical protein
MYLYNHQKSARAGHSVLPAPLRRHPPLHQSPAICELCRSANGPSLSAKLDTNLFHRSVNIHDLFHDLFHDLEVNVILHSIPSHLLMKCSEEKERDDAVFV